MLYFKCLHAHSYQYFVAMCGVYPEGGGLRSPGLQATRRLRAVTEDPRLPGAPLLCSRCAAGCSLGCPLHGTSPEQRARDTHTFSTYTASATNELLKTLKLPLDQMHKPRAPSRGAALGLTVRPERARNVPCGVQARASPHGVKHRQPQPASAPIRKTPLCMKSRTARSQTLPGPPP